MSFKIINNQIVIIETPKCTYSGCDNIATNIIKGSLIKLCDIHKKKIDKDIKQLTNKQESEGV
jgi:Na+-translocating ferredoxin:NAD+ oxidoreductase RNF subunit RnfB